MTEPQEVTDRRWSFNLLEAVAHISNCRDIGDLHDTELIDDSFTE